MHYEHAVKPSKLLINKTVSSILKMNIVQVLNYLRDFYLIYCTLRFIFILCGIEKHVVFKRLEEFT